MKRDFLRVNCIFVCFLILLSFLVMCGWRWSSWGQCRFIGRFIEDSSSETRSLISYLVGDILFSQPKAIDYLSSSFLWESWKSLVGMALHSFFIHSFRNKRQPHFITRAFSLFLTNWLIDKKQIQTPRIKWPHLMKANDQPTQATKTP